MKVLYLVFQALLGGHVLSASTIAKEMRTQGVSPVFAGAEGAMTSIIQRDMPFEPVTIPIFHGTRQTYFTWASFAAARHLREIIRRHEIDLIHAFDARSYFHAYVAGLLEQVPVLCTLCGGIDPYYNLPAAPTLIVFSEEQKEKMVWTFRWPASRVEVVRNRLDLGQMEDAQHRLGEAEAAAFGLDPQVPKIMMISSFDDTKIRSIHKVLDATEMLFSRGM
ncbi:MAG: glycosyltransferase, partial [Desulfuromonadaceae bacterium]|nr:glycosyltransferase [Desulfuromonadaceae bacterium]